jgi:isopropylmalate/homocitrate/citramalate synthase
MNVTVYEVGPRDGLQSLKFPIPSSKKIELIDALYDAGLTEIEEVSFAHPKLVPQMADAEKVFQHGGALVMNKHGYDRAIATGAKKINIVISPCETFNMKNMRKTRSELVLMYKTFLDKTPKENVRVYISMAFGSPFSGEVSPGTMHSCIRDAKMFGNTVVFADTVGVGTREEVHLWSEMAILEGMAPALHLHHKGDESKALQLIRAGLMAGIREFDSSIGGLGGCPFVDNSGANLSTETLVLHLNAWGFETGVCIDTLRNASIIAQQIALNEKEHRVALLQ